MDRYNKERLVEIVNYVLNKTGVLDYYTLLKTIYFAEAETLGEMGKRMTAEDTPFDASNIMLPLRKANEDYLWESEKEALDTSSRRMPL